MGRVVRVRGAGAVRVARDQLLPLLAFVVHCVAQRACDRHQEAYECDAEDEDAAAEVEALTSRDLWEQSISLGAVVSLGGADGGIKLSLDIELSGARDVK